MASNAATGEDTLGKWKESTLDRPGMTLVTAGQAGAGKSTLVKNLLHMADNDANAPIAGHSAVSITNEVKRYSSLINDVNVTIIDTPGLAGASNDDQAKILAELSEVSKGKADMLLYCISMAPSSKVGALDRRIVDLLTMAFSPKIWERTVVVLTSADLVKERNEKKRGNPTVQAVMKEYATTFQKLLPGGMTVTPVLRKDCAMERDANEIAAVATGETPDEEILPGMKWNECVYKEVLKKCSLEAIPEMFKLLEISSGAWKGALGGAAAGAVAGVGVGFVVGGVGAIPGGVGGAIGGAVGGGGGYGAVHYSFEKSDKGKLAKEYADIKKKRKSDTNKKNE